MKLEIFQFLNLINHLKNEMFYLETIKCPLVSKSGSSDQKGTHLMHQYHESWHRTESLLGLNLSNSVTGTGQVAGAVGPLPAS